MDFEGICFESPKQLSVIFLMASVSNFSLKDLAFTEVVTVHVGSCPPPVSGSQSSQQTTQTCRDLLGVKKKKESSFDCLWAILVGDLYDVGAAFGAAQEPACWTACALPARLRRRHR